MVRITISGAPGSGTTTTSKLLADKINVNYVYAGDIFRDMAKKHGMSLEEFGNYCEKHKEIDEKLDEYQKKLLESEDIILEGRIAGWIAHQNNINALKILLEADTDTRAKRIVEREKGSLKDKKKKMLKREKSEAKRYKKYYDIDLKDKSVYDLVINTANKTKIEVVDIIINELSIEG